MDSFKIKRSIKGKLTYNGKDVETLLNVLNIISKKNVNVQQIRESKTVSEYNHYVIEHYIGFVVTLTEEEFKLIKENL